VGGRGRLLLLTGEAGIGKTAVTAEAAAGAPVPRPGCAGRRPCGHDGATGPVTVGKDDSCDAVVWWGWR
jgi:hypothetical protein